MYLQLRRRLWYALHEIPIELRPVLGKPRFCASLHTSNKREAQSRAALFEARWRLEIERARSGTEHDPVEEEARFWRQALKEAHEHEKDAIKEGIRQKAEDMFYAVVDPLEDPNEAFDQGKGKEADRFFDIAMGNIVRFDEHIDEWMATLANESKTKDMKRSTALKFSEEFLHVSDVTRKAVQRWATQQLQDGKKAKTLRRILSELRSYWDFLVSIESAPEDSRPFDKLTLPKAGKGDGVEDKRLPFTPVEVVQLLAGAVAGEDNDLADLIRLGMWSGARIEELCALKLDKVHEDHFEIEDAKTPAGWRLVPIHPKLSPVVERLREKGKDGYLLSGLTANKYGDRSNAIGKRFGRLKTALGFGDRHVFHSIRKTVATLLENAGVPENVASDILGHEKPTMTYGLYSGGNALEVMREALRRIDYPGT